MTLPAFSFRFKLLLSMMLVMAGLIGSTLYVVQERQQYDMQGRQGAGAAQDVSRFPAA